LAPLPPLTEPSPLANTPADTPSIEQPIVEPAAAEKPVAAEKPAAKPVPTPEPGRPYYPPKYPVVEQQDQPWYLTRRTTLSYPARGVMAVVGLLILAMIVGVPQCSSNQAGATKPEQVVQGYLQALAAGDASKALSYSYESSSYEATSLLTDSVLAVSNHLAPIRNIHVSPGQGNWDVKATYTMGSTQVSTSFLVYPQGQSGYAIRTYALVSMPGDTCVPLATINGQLVDCSHLGMFDVFPGTYQVSGTSVTPNPFRIRFPDDVVILMPG